MGKYPNAIVKSEVQPNLSYVTFQGNIDMGMHKTGGR
jgi:hypothetical protein